MKLHGCVLERPAALGNAPWRADGAEPRRRAGGALRATRAWARLIPDAAVVAASAVAAVSASGIAVPAGRGTTPGPASTDDNAPDAARGFRAASGAVGPVSCALTRGVQVHFISPSLLVRTRVTGPGYPRDVASFANRRQRKVPSHDQHPNPIGRDGVRGVRNRRVNCSEQYRHGLRCSVAHHRGGDLHRADGRVASTIRRGLPPPTGPSTCRTRPTTWWRASPARPPRPSPAPTRQRGRAATAARPRRPRWTEPTALARPKRGTSSSPTPRTTCPRDHADGVIHLIAGNGTEGDRGDGGLATHAELDSPQGVAVDGTGDVFIADTDNKCPGGHPAGAIITVAGNGTAGYNGDNGPAPRAELIVPTGLAVDALGDLYIADSGNNVIRRVSTTGSSPRWPVT